MASYDKFGLWRLPLSFSSKGNWVTVNIFIEKEFLPKVGTTGKVMEGYYWILVILVADLCLLQTNL